METRTIFSLHQKLGRIVRLGPNEISVNSATGLRTIYTGGFEKHEWYRDNLMNYGAPNLVSMLENRPHSVQKRILSHIYSKSYLQSSPELRTISEVMIFDRLFPVLRSAAQNDTPLNVLELSQALGMDFTSAYLFGLTNGTNFVEDVETRRRWLSLYSTFKIQSTKDRALGEIEQWCLSMCEAAETFTSSKVSGESPSTAPVVYEQLAMGLDESSLSQPKNVVIASEMLDHLIAGHETSGITITYLMYELSRRPELQSRLCAELCNLFPTTVCSTRSAAARDTKDGISDRMATPRSIDALPLIDAVLQETLRLYAAAPAPQPRVTPFPPTTIEGYTNIPGGVKVSSSAYTLHRNAEVFPEPEKWIPERWLEADAGKRKEMRRWFWAFGSGGRMCIGSNFAMQGGVIEFTIGFLWLTCSTEMKLAVAAIYSNYTTHIVDAEGIEPADAYIAAPVGNKLILGFKQV